MNRCAALYDWANEAMLEKQCPYDDVQGWVNTQELLLEPVWSCSPIMPTSLVDLLVTCERVSLTSEQSHAVETIQRRAMQIISPHKTYDEALHDHRLVTLQQRRNELCNRLFKDIQNSSHRLNSLLPLQHNPGYQLRHSKKYPLPLVKTNRFKYSFINLCLYNCQ